MPKWQASAITLSTCVAVVGDGNYAAVMEHRSTHARISINESGEAEVRQLDVVADCEQGERHSLLSIDVGPAIEAINQAERDREEPPAA